MTLSNAQVGATIKGDYSSALDLTTALASLTVTRGAAFDNGTGAGQADKIFSDTRTLGISASEDLDLAGVLLDAFGAAITFARVKGLMIAASPSNTNNVLVGGVTNGFVGFLTPAATGIITLRPGSFLCVGCGSADATGFVVTPATGDLLHVANSGAGTSVTYDVVVIGSSV